MPPWIWLSVARETTLLSLRHHFCHLANLVLYGLHRRLLAPHLTLVIRKALLMLLVALLSDLIGIRGVGKELRHHLLQLRHTMRGVLLGAAPGALVLVLVRSLLGRLTTTLVWLLVGLVGLLVGLERLLGLVGLLWRGGSLLESERVLVRSTRSPPEVRVISPTRIISVAVRVILGSRLITHVVHFLVACIHHPLSTRARLVRYPALHTQTIGLRYVLLRVIESRSQSRYLCRNRRIVIHGMHTSLGR